MPRSAADVKSVAVIGCGSMGGGIALLLAENGYNVSLQDPSEEAMDKVIEQGKKDEVKGDVSKHTSIKSLTGSLDSPKVFLWSLPHGTVGDSVLGSLMPHLDKGDVIIDCANEHWENSERRMGKCVTRGIRYVACGVSGGYQAARRGPSLCPSSDDETLDLVLPLLARIAAKDSEGNACVGRVGTGGAGHYCKMIHNGIEHGMMSAICEAWEIMTTGLGMSLDEAADEFDRWNADGELKNTFLVKISADICRAEDPKTGERVLRTVEDKVVQDITGEEGTGIWSNIEAVQQHVPAPTLSVAHYLRIASAFLDQRRKAQKNFDGPLLPAQKISLQGDRREFLEQLRLAVYAGCLASYVQGLLVIEKANREKHFNVDFKDLLQVWKAGCIIATEYISHHLLQPIFAAHSGPSEDANPLYHGDVAKDFKNALPALKNVVLRAVEADHVVPSLSATLEYLKIMTSTSLPTNFYEAQLDYFGSHMYDKKGEDELGLAETGKYHFEWKPA